MDSVKEKSPSKGVAPHKTDTPELALRVSNVYTVYHYNLEPFLERVYGRPVVLERFFPWGGYTGFSEAFSLSQRFDPEWDSIEQAIHAWVNEPHENLPPSIPIEFLLADCVRRGLIPDTFDSFVIVFG